MIRILGTILFYEAPDDFRVEIVENTVINIELAKLSPR